MTAHFLGEYHDLESDKLNFHSSRFTGGSKVLVTGEVSEDECLTLGYGCSAVAVAILFGVLPPHTHVIGAAMLAIAHQYSAPPFKLNHNGLGELAAAVVMNILLPYFAALVNAEEGAFNPHVFFDSRLAVLVVPSAFLKFGLFCVLNASNNALSSLSLSLARSLCPARNVLAVADEVLRTMLPSKRCSGRTSQGRTTEAPLAGPPATARWLCYADVRALVTPLLQGRGSSRGLAWRQEHTGRGVG